MVRDYLNSSLAGLVNRYGVGLKIIGLLNMMAFSWLCVRVLLNSPRHKNNLTELPWTEDLIIGIILKYM